MNKMTAAHKRLPFETWLKVENLANGRSTQVRVNDRGPFVGKRIIDLSRAAAADIQMIGTGTARVRLTVIRPPGRQARAASGQTRPSASPQEATSAASSISKSACSRPAPTPRPWRSACRSGGIARTSCQRPKEAIGWSWSAATATKRPLA